MSEEAAFVAALAANPTDKTAALVFADWLDDRGDPRGPMLRDDVVRAFMAPEYENPLPQLRKALETGKGVTRANNVFARVGEAAVPEIVPLLTHEKPIVRLRTVKALRRMASKARPAVPALLEFVKGKSTDDVTARREAVRLLGVLRVKKDATDEMAKGLDSESDADRLAAVEAMARLRTKTAAGSLCKALGDSSEAVRHAAALQLFHLASPTLGAAVEPLRAALADPVTMVRRNALDALGKIGPKAAAAVPDVVRLLNAAPAPDAHHFVEALGKIGVGSAEALDALLGELKNPDACHPAVLAVGQWPSLPPSAAPALLAFLAAPLSGSGHAGHHTRRATVHAVAKINPPTREVLDVLRAELHTENSSSVAKALGAVGPAAAALVPDLAAALGRGTGEHRDPYLIAHALGKIGGDGVRALAKALDREYPADDSIPIAAAGGLKEAGAGAAAALPVLLARLARFRDKAPPNGLAFITSTLAAIGPAAAGAVPDMVALLLDPDCPDHTAYSLCEALAAFGPAVLPFAPQLVARLGTPSRGREHVYAVELLTALVPHGFDGFAVFLDVLRRVTAEEADGRDTRNSFVRSDLVDAAVAGLKAVGPKAEAAVPDLVLAEKTFERPVLREKVIAAFGAIGGAAVPHIRAATAHAWHDTRVAAIAALVASGDVSAESQDALRTLEHDANKTVRLRATAALKQMGTPKRKRK